jgi:predicted RNase H-like HicB family nuclease
MTETVLDRTDSIEIKKDKSETLPEAVDDEQVREVISRAMSEIEQFPELPMQLIGKYAQIAAWGHGALKRLPDGGWFATIPDFEGVWASEPSRNETLEALEEVVLDWTILKIQHKDKDLPVLEEIDLNAL